MSDGVQLAADLYVPDDGRDDFVPSTPLPVVMDYIPYRKDEVNPGLAHHYLYLARHDYILARVDIRGTGASEGVNTDEYTLQEQTDGAEAVEWFAAQPWCDGHVNIIGISYGGFTALQVASHRPPHLTSIIPVAFTDDRYTDDCHYRGGLLRMYYDIGWYGTRMIAWGAMPPDPEWSLDDWAGVQHLIHKVHGAPAEFHAVVERLALGVQPRKGGQQRRVNIEHALREGPHEIRAQQAREARQAHQVDRIPVELVDQPVVIRDALHAERRQQDCVQATLPRRLEPLSTGPISNYDRDLGLDSAAGHLIGDSFEVGAAPRQQNAQPLHR